MTNHGEKRRHKSYSNASFIGQYLITHLSPSHVPDIFTFKLKMFSYDLFTIRVSDSGVNVKKRQNSTDVNNRQTTEPFNHPFKILYEKKKK
jgi:hypothetical protein